jgi:glycosyltransferase involved in cell wall biosynthesis
MGRTESWRTLILARMLYPPMGGEYLRNWQTINLLKQCGAVAVFSLFERDLVPPALAGVETWYHFNLSADRSMRSRLEQITQWFRQAGLTYYCPYRTAAAQALEKAIATFQPNLVILEQLWMIPYLSIVQRYPCQVIYDAHNVEVPLYEQTQCVGGDIRSLARRMMHIPQIHHSEQQLLHQTDQVWVCSQADRSQLGDRYGTTHRLQIIPNGLDNLFYAEIFQQRRQPHPLTHNVIFIGNFAHHPNAEAAEILLTEIYPALRRQFPQTQLFLVGRNPTPTMIIASRGDTQITVTGEVEDIRPYLATARVMVVPLRQGSGTRLKILEAFAAGCPVVSTAKGAEGLQCRGGEHFLRAEGTGAILQAIHQLWGDPVLEATLIKAAHDLLQSAYSWEAVSTTVGNALQQLERADEKRKADH